MLRKLGTTPEVSEGSIWSQAQIRRAAELGLGIQSPTPPPNGDYRVRYPPLIQIVCPVIH